MVLIALDNNILNELCSKDQLELLDSVDRLRSQGIDSYVSLPQIIVCGDQSSGKSSVLEAISGVSFPVKSNLCTRFPTELILRKTPRIEVSISIVPDPSHSESESRALRSFNERLDSFNELPELVEKAKAAMAISTFGKAFSKDLLRIEVSGPDRPHLTIVDLPGLIHSETKQQSSSDIEMVQDVIQSYMREPRSIILAVISAKNDYANQIVLKLARAADRMGDRTLGVITKPDTLIPDSASERTFVSLAQNLDVNFRLGWHVLRNMDSDTGVWSLIERDTREREFFSQGIWRTLPNSILGIGALRERLSGLLLAQIAAELPGLIDEIRTKSDTCRSQLQKLGTARITPEEQRLYLLQLSEMCQSLTKAAMDGTYSDPFFGDPNSDAGYRKRMRAIIQNLNESFANTIVRGGHLYNITDSPDDSAISGVTIITRTKFMDHIEHLMNRTKGRELPGTYNPMIITDLFVAQSRPWESIARKHAKKVSDAVKDFLRLLVAYTADKTTSAQLFARIFEPAAEKLQQGLERKLTELLAEHQNGHPITYNHHFAQTVDEVWSKRAECEYTSIIQKFFQCPTTYHELSDFQPLLKALMDHNKPSASQSSCSRALDHMQAYYKIALERFIDDVSVEAVEANMVSKLHEILRPTNVALMAAVEVTKIAGESEGSRVLRAQLANQLEVLTAGIETCKRIMSIGLPGKLCGRDLEARPQTAKHNQTSRSWSKTPITSPSSSKVTASSGEVVDITQYQDGVKDIPSFFNDSEGWGSPKQLGELYIPRKKKKDKKRHSKPEIP